jgi:hypothetical protein
MGREKYLMVSLLKEKSILNLYREILNRHLDQTLIGNNINLEWNELNSSIIEAADEVL